MSFVLDQSKPHQKYFEEMCRIPHGTYNEQAYSDYLVNWAKEHDLKFIRDEMQNVIIYKPASPGYEDHDSVILQGHMDMVCAKTKTSTHDFSKDPLDLYIEDGWLRARDTTLGADDGVGCAYMLAILDDDELKHPPLECAFTVQEEVGCNGAAVLKSGYFKGNRMIGLDDVGGGTSYVSTAGSQMIEFVRKVTWEKYSGKAYKLEIGGLLSGHSAVDIDKERGHSIQIVDRTLYPLIKKGIDVRLADVNMGSAGNAIPCDGEVVFTADMPEEQLKEHIDKYYDLFKEQLAHSDSGLQMTLTPCEINKVMSKKDTEDIISFLRLLPQGFMHKDIQKQDSITVSNNLGTLKLEGDLVKMLDCSRSSMESYIEMIEEEQQMLSAIYKIERNVIGRLPGFNYIENSKIRKTVDEALYQVSGRHIEEIYVHGGIEAAYIVNLKENMDIVTIGPLAPDEHTVKESLNLESFDQIYEVIKLALSKL